MKITHLVENLERAGLERAVIDLVGAQREAGRDCRVICLFERGALAAICSKCMTVSGQDVHAPVRAARQGVARTEKDPGT